MKRTGDLDFLILACDGIWDCMTSQEAVDYVHEDLAKNLDSNPDYKTSNVIANMFEKNIAEDISSSNGIGCDNMTCTIIRFK